MTNDEADYIKEQMKDAITKNEEPFKLVFNKTDKEIAEEHKKKIIDAVEPLMQALTDARADGFVTQLNFGENAFNKIVVHQFSIMKVF